jgi:hypothetical protein
MPIWYVDMVGAYYIHGSVSTRFEFFFPPQIGLFNYLYNEL